ncbi:MAG: hypothetical protein IT323_00935, partial [Anaerolineae bacterium]|nr:hypothetical protein [Anaerolineae bacterium]
MTPNNWPSTPPPGCPFEPSRAIRGIAFTGRAAHYTHADTWYPSWAADGNLYSPWTDGNFKYPIVDINHFDCSSDSRNRTNADKGGKSGTGNARITGNDPLRLNVEDLGVQYASPAPYGGRYPCGSLVHDGVWYYGTYCLDESDRGLNWDILGPFVGFRVSRDYGKTWEDTPHSAAKPIFGESGKHGGKVKIGAPHVVDFGQNMQHSPDGKAYLVAHGASRPESEAAWIAGDEAYLFRVTPSPETINDPAAYEFFAGHQDGAPSWTRDFARIKPLIDWPGRIGHATMSYVAPLNKYLMFCTDGWPT